MSRETGFVKGYVDAPWGQIHYVEAGAGEAVLLYPNRPRSSVIYRRLAAILAAQYRVLIMDPPGFGASDPLPAPLEVDDLSAAVVTLLDGLGVDRFRMSGHHTGAALCVDLAVRIPERVVAIAPSGLLMLTEVERRGRLDGSLFSPAAGNPPRADGSHLLPFLKKYPPVPPEDLDFLTDWIVDTLASEPHQRPSADAVYRYDERARLPRIQAPTLFVQSTGPGEPPTLQRMADAHALTPGSRLALIEGGDVHFIHHRADELGELLLDFFAGP